jgi:Arc/MetJ-type ribon-helix-helix transcriptional regulator
MPEQVVGAHLPESTIKQIDEAVEKGEFLNRSDAIRCLLRGALMRWKEKQNDQV